LTRRGFRGGLPSQKQRITVDAKIQEGFALYQQGRFGEASKICETVLKIDRRNFNALAIMGTVTAQQRQFEKAISWLRAAINVNDKVEYIHNSLGNVFKELKRFGEALASYDNAIRLKPDYAEVYSHRGAVLVELNRLDEAMASYDKAIALKPDYSDVHYNLGNALKKLKRLDQALASFDKAILLKPNFADAYNNRGNVLGDLKRLDEALASCNKAIGLNPDYAEAYNNRGVVLRELLRFDEALASHDKAIALKPDYAEAHGNRGLVLTGLKRLDEALVSYGKADTLKADTEFFGHYLNTKMMICDWKMLPVELQKLATDVAAGKKASPPFVVLGVLDSPQLQKASAKTRGDISFPKDEGLGPITKRPPHKKIRIGYYSADFHEHATAYLMAELFEAHNTDSFEVYGISFGRDSQDNMRRRLSSAFHRFLDVRIKTDREVAQLSRDLGIDVAIDLKGYTLDSRPGIFANRCASVQVNYLGFPGTMAADYFDYIIADKTVIPEQSKSDFTEKVVYLPYSYQVNDSKRAISDRVFTKQEVGLPETGFVFCCFNNNYKILPATFDGWMKILLAVEGSVLWLLQDSSTAAGNLRREAEARGVHSSRLIFAERMQLDHHLARHRLADLFLDTLPCNAHTTASDALWAGLPVLTCMGRSFAGRVAGSLLRAIELPELVTHTPLEFETRAIDLAKDRAKLQLLKSKLEANRFTTPLFNTRLFAKHLEAAYEVMFRRYQAGLPPADFEVGA